MPYTYNTKTDGSASTAIFSQMQGWKMVPHVKNLRLPKPYNRLRWEYISGNTDYFNLRAAGGLWQEFAPEHQMLGSASDNSFVFGTLGNQCYAKAYGKFMRKISSQANNLTAVSERGKTIKMVLKRMTQIRDGASYLRQGHFKKFLETFGVKPKPEHANKIWSRPQDFGKLWLEYWMGWAPTCMDIYTSLEFLGQKPPDQPIRAGSTQAYNGNKTVSSNGSVASSNWSGECTVWVKATVVITNTEAYDLNRLGLLNPAKTAFETVKLSWMVDWFTNIGQYLGQMTDTVGMEVKDLVVSCKTTATCTYQCTNAKNQFGQSAPATVKRQRKLLGFSRKTGGTLPFFKPYLAMPKELSASRGATLASLLVTWFTPKRDMTYVSPIKRIPLKKVLS